MMIAAIDPGLKGGICFSGGDICEVFDLPYCGKEIDDQALTLLWQQFKPDHVVCELPICLPGRSSGAKTSFLNYGRLKQFALDRGASWHEITASVWTKSAPKEKEDRIRLCREKYPTIDIPKSKDGRADALLIKEFAWRTEPWK